MADLGNLSKAAEQLHMTQSGLSRAVAEVEDIVGGKLFERSAKGMVSTALGAVMCRYASLLLSDMHKAEADLAAVAGGGAGTLVIGCFSMFTRWPVAEAILAFRKSSPGVQITVEVGRHESLIERLDTGAIDLLVSRTPRSLNGQTYRTVELGEDGVALACAPDHPLTRLSDVTMADCVRYPWVSAPPGSLMRELINTEVREAGLEPPEILGALSLELGRELVLSGEFLWHLASSTARHLASLGEVVVLPARFALNPGPMAAIWRRERSSTRAARAFIVALRHAVDAAHGG